MPCPVLIIEDDPDIRRTFVELLEWNSHEATAVATGGEALSVLRSGEQFGLILLDLWLPETNGWTFRRRQLEEDLQPDIPIVVVSGVVDNLQTEAAAIGAAEAVAKPVTPDRLLELVDTYCREAI